MELRLTDLVINHLENGIQEDPRGHLAVKEWATVLHTRLSELAIQKKFQSPFRTIKGSFKPLTAIVDVTTFGFRCASLRRMAAAQSR